MSRSPPVVAVPPTVVVGVDVVRVGVRAAAMPPGVGVVVAVARGVVGPLAVPT